MRKNPFGDCVVGLLGGTLTAYLGVSALQVLLTGKAPGLGPAMPIVAGPDSGALWELMVRLLQAFYFAGLAGMTFFGGRIVQERLRGHGWRSALREAATGPRLW